MLIIEPTSGLANRMRVIAASVCWAEIVGTKVECIWRVTPDLHASFSDLFKESNRFSIR